MLRVILLGLILFQPAPKYSWRVNQSWGFYTTPNTTSGYLICGGVKYDDTKNSTYPWFITTKCGAKENSQGTFSTFVQAKTWVEQNSTAQ